MQDSVSYPKPQLVTEDRIREALAKQEKQKALREALDRQIKESATRKDDGLGGTPRDRTPATRSPALQNETAQRDVSEPPPSPYTRTHAPGEARGSGHANAGPLASASAPPVQPVEPTRYTLDFANGNALFIREDSSNRVATSASGTPRNGAGATAAKGAKETPDRASRLAGARPGARAPSNAKANAKSRSPTTEVVRQQTPPGAAAASKLPSAPRNRAPKKQPDGKTGVSTDAAGATHDSQSLPANIEAVLRERGMLPSKPAAAAGKRRAGTKSTDRTTSPPVHDTQSLPVDLVRELTAAANRHQAQPQARPPPLRPRGNSDHFSTPDKARLTDDEALTHRSATDTFALPSYQRELSEEDARRSSSGSRAQPHSTPNRLKLDEALLAHDAKAKPGSANAALLSPGGGRARKGRTPPLSSRPPGGVLPPLERPTSQGSSAGVIEMSAQFSPTHAAAPSASRAPAVSEVERLQRQLRSRGEEMKKLQEKERNWEDQVKRLREELVQAKRRDMQVKRAAAHGVGAPPRAGTAPDQPIKNDVQPKDKPSRYGKNPGAVRAVGGSGGEVPAGRPSQPASAISAPRKTDFSKAKIFTPNSFRPITAPEFTENGVTQLPPAAGAAFDWQGAQQKHRKQQAPTSMAAPGSREVRAMQKARKQSDSSAQANIRAPEAPHTVEPDDLSFKGASLSTRQTLLGLPEGSVADPVAISFDHLREFAEAAFITQSQAEALWQFFGGTVPTGQNTETHSCVPREYTTEDQLSPMEPSIVVEEVFADARSHSQTHTAPGVGNALLASHMQQSDAGSSDSDDDDDDDDADEAEAEAEDDDGEEDGEETEYTDEGDDEDEEEDATPAGRGPPPLGTPLHPLSDLSRVQRLSSPTNHAASPAVLAPSLRRKISRHATEDAPPRTE